MNDDWINWSEYCLQQSSFPWNALPRLHIRKCPHPPAPVQQQEAFQVWERNKDSSWMYVLHCFDNHYIELHIYIYINIYTFMSVNKNNKKNTYIYIYCIAIDLTPRVILLPYPPSNSQLLQWKVSLFYASIFTEWAHTQTQGQKTRAESVKNRSPTNALEGSYWHYFPFGASFQEDMLFSCSVSPLAPHKEFCRTCHQRTKIPASFSCLFIVHVQTSNESIMGNKQTH